MKNTIATIVFAIAEKPLWNATVIAPARTASPSSRAVSLSANVGRLVRSVAAVVIRVTIPRFLDAASVLASEFRFRIARSRMTNSWIFIRSVATVVIAIAFPRSENTTTGRIALEFVLRTRDVAVAFVRTVAAIVDTVAKRRGRRAVVVVTLELTGLAESFLTGARFVCSVLTILFAVTFPVERNATVVFASATMLTCITKRNHFNIR